jgi:hypothetical protein
MTVDRRPIEERIAAVRAQEEAGELPVTGDKSWQCSFCDFGTVDPQEAIAHEAIHPPSQLEE